MTNEPSRAWFPFSLPELELGLAVFGCLITALTLAGISRPAIVLAAIGFLVVAYLAGLLVYSRRQVREFEFLIGVGNGGRGYIDLVKKARRSLLLMHADEDTPVDELLCIYRGLLDNGVEQRRLIFLREHAKSGAYNWIERNGTHANLQQRVVLPEQAEVMRLSFVIIDEEVVVISVPGSGALDGPAYSRDLVFRDLLVLRDVSVASAFVEIHRQLWSNASMIGDPRRLCAPGVLLAEVRCRLKGAQ